MYSRPVRLEDSVKLYTFISHMRTTCPAHIVLLDFITLTGFAEEQKLLSFS